MKRLFFVIFLLIIALNAYSVDKVHNMISSNPLAFIIHGIYDLEYERVFDCKTGFSVSPWFIDNQVDNWKWKAYGGKLGLKVYHSQEYPKGSNAGIFMAATNFKADYSYPTPAERPNDEGWTPSDHHGKLTTNSFILLPGILAGYSWITKKNILINLTCYTGYAMGEAEVHSEDDNIDERLPFNGFIYSVEIRIGYSW